ncbi:MAG: hypothetical protein ACLR2O_17335 [Coprococcus sp.]
MYEKMMIPGKIGVSSRSEGNLYLFEKYYEDEYQSGTYEVVSISVTENGETTDYALADLKMEAKFGVNQNMMESMNFSRLMKNRKKRQRKMQLVFRFLH